MSFLTLHENSGERFYLNVDKIIKLGSNNAGTWIKVNDHGDDAILTVTESPEEIFKQIRTLKKFGDVAYE